MGQTSRHFEDLLAWQRAMDFAAEVHRLTLKLPRHERFALADQLRRAGVSVPSNIAEGQARGPTEDFCRFLRISLGSLQEAQTQLRLAERFGYLDSGDLKRAFNLADEVTRLTRGLLQSVMASTSNVKRPTSN